MLFAVAVFGLLVRIWCFINPSISKISGAHVTYDDLLPLAFGYFVFMHIPLRFSVHSMYGGIHSYQNCFVQITNFIAAILGGGNRGSKCMYYLLARLIKAQPQYTGMRLNG
jgi:hypothetical protein